VEQIAIEEEEAILLRWDQHAGAVEGVESAGRMAERYNEARCGL
jgi:hypothetical protein